MNPDEMTGQRLPPLWHRFWPVYCAALPGLWPLAGQIRQHIDQQGPALAAAADPATLVTAGLVQTALLFLVASLTGAALAHRVGLTSILAHRRGTARFLAGFPLAAGLGASLGCTLAMLDLLVFMPLSPDPPATPPHAAGSREQALLLGVLYGGISEEVMMRWGLMTMICWGLMRLSRKPSPTMPGQIAWTGILASAFLFALGHLPAMGPAGGLEVLPVVRVLVLNTLAGTVLGWIFWKRSLESAFVAHAFVHVSFYVIG